MCALQECSSTPLLSANGTEMKCPEVVSTKKHSNDSLDQNSSNFSEPIYQTVHGTDNEHGSEYLPPETLDYSAQNSFNPMQPPPSMVESQNCGLTQYFQVPRSSKSVYTELNPPRTELEYLLCNKHCEQLSQPVREADIQNFTKKSLSQRSISDYYLSKRYEESKLTITPNISSDMNPYFNESIQSCNQFCANQENADIHVCHSNDVNAPSCFDEYNGYRPYKSNGTSIDCEPGVSNCSDYSEDHTKNFDVKKTLKACNLNTATNHKIFDTESLSESGDFGNNGATSELSTQRVMDDTWFITSAQHTFGAREQLSGSASAAQLSLASSFGDSSTPTCKICHMPAKTDDPLISPCRCTGTLHYIHCGCLMRWLEICNKRSRKPPACELCKYQFHWHKKFKVRHWQFPHCSWRDKILHTVFLISVLVMIGCAIVTVMCFRQHRGNTHLELTQSEIISLICGALFFLAFFLAMYVEIKARNTIYKLLVKFIYLNQQWYIDEYDKKGENTVIDV